MYNTNQGCCHKRGIVVKSEELSIKRDITQVRERQTNPREYSSEGHCASFKILKSFRAELFQVSYCYQICRAIMAVSKEEP